MAGKTLERLRGRRSRQAGFTLVELLIVVVILGVLAAIVSVSLLGLTSNAKLNACKTEVKGLQSAIDSYMAKQSLDSINAAPAGGTQDMTTNLGGTDPALYPNYMRSQHTDYAYHWTATGQIDGIFAGSEASVPAGCTAPS